MILPVKRHPLRLHLSTWTVLAVLALAVSWLNYRGSPPDELTRYSYGWPVIAYRHWSPPDGGDAALMSQLSDFYKGLGAMFGYVPNQWDGRAITYDSVVFMGLLCTLGYGWERRLRINLAKTP